MAAPADNEIPADHEIVFNVVWTGTTFDHLLPFVRSQMAQSDARFRFVANGCPPDQVVRLHRYAAAHSDRVVDVFEVGDQMIPHGIALDRVRAVRDDGAWFALIDPDIKANARFVPPMADHLRDGCVAVTSGTEVWSDDNLVPPGHPGVAGEHFVGQDGFVFGSPHLALYRRDALEATCARWGIGFGSGGKELTDEGRARLAELGQEYWIYDTGKLVNAFLQADGHRLVHVDFDYLVHIGGLSHFLAPTGWTTGDDGERAPNWSKWPGNPSRYDVAEFTAAVLRALAEHRTPPAVPETADPALAARLRMVVGEVVDLIARYGDEG